MKIVKEHSHLEETDTLTLLLEIFSYLNNAVACTDELIHRSAPKENRPQNVYNHAQEERQQRSKPKIIRRPSKGKENHDTSSVGMLLDVSRLCDNIMDYVDYLLDIAAEHEKRTR